MMFLSNWLSGFGQAGRLPITTEYYTGDRVYMGQQSPITDALHRGGAVVVRLFLDEWHYVLLTGERDGWASLAREPPGCALNSSRCPPPPTPLRSSRNTRREPSN